MQINVYEKTLKTKRIYGYYLWLLMLAEVKMKKY